MRWHYGEHPGIGGSATFDQQGDRIYSVRATVEYCADCLMPPIPSVETPQDLETAAADPWIATVGDCRYEGGFSGTHCGGSCNLLQTLHDQPDLQACKNACLNNTDCHAFDTDYP
eukprot:SAG31_NODE_20198_length_581_cov_1.012448_2_plen_114_part_01